jgi:hypothetical protein
MAQIEKGQRRIEALFADAGVNTRGWWAWAQRPPSLRTMWRLSDYQPHRVHAGNRNLSRVWKIMNVTERPALFLVVLLAPGFLQPLLRWAFQRPTRRVGLYIVTALLALGAAAVVGSR